MKTSIHIVICLVFIQNSLFAQSNNTEKPFEMGLQLVNAGIYPFQQREFQVDYLSGLFFRYNRQKIAFRGSLSYNEGSYEECKDCNDAVNGILQYSQFQTQIGAQYSILKNKEWLYGYLDLGYRNQKFVGDLSGGNTGQSYYKVNNTTNSILANIGIGCRIQLFRTLSLSPEIDYGFSYNFLTDNGLYSENGYAGLQPLKTPNYTNYVGFTTARLLLSARF